MCKGQLTMNFPKRLRVDSSWINMRITLVISVICKIIFKTQVLFDFLSVCHTKFPLKHIDVCGRNVKKCGKVQITWNTLRSSAAFNMLHPAAILSFTLFILCSRNNKNKTACVRLLFVFQTRGLCFTWHVWSYIIKTVNFQKESLCTPHVGPFFFLLPPLHFPWDN